MRSRLAYQRTSTKRFLGKTNVTYPVPIVRQYGRNVNVSVVGVSACDLCVKTHFQESVLYVVVVSNVTG